MNDFKLIQGDCLEVMKSIPSGSIDMILCDLPYGNTDCDWDTKIPLNELWENYLRVIKINGAIVLTAMEPFASEIIMSARNHFRYDMIWDKVGVSGFLNANKMPMRTHEHVLVFYKKLPTYNAQKTSGRAYSKTRTRVAEVYKKVNNATSNSDGLMFPTSIIRIPKESCTGSNESRRSNSFHPTQKPTALMEWLIKTYTNEGETVLDNCMGSGTTGVACKNLNRKFIGIEKEEKYFLVASERIKNAPIQIKLLSA